MKYSLQLRFKLLAIAKQITAADAAEKFAKLFCV